MGRGELCYDQCVGLLLAGHTRSISAAGSDVRGAFVQAPYLSPGFGDLNMKRVLKNRQRVKSITLVLHKIP